MKFKISWPIGIIIAITAFVVFILSFVYKATFIPAYNHHLVSDNYYKDELNYQQEIDEQNLAASLKQNVTLTKISDGILISFPEEFDPTKITGTILFKRLSDEKIDFKIPIKLENNKYLIKDEVLIKGIWNVRIKWKVGDKSYLLKEKIIY